MGSIHEKPRRPKISCYCLFNGKCYVGNVCPAIYEYNIQLSTTDLISEKINEKGKRKGGRSEKKVSGRTEVKGINS
jgi:hypothetical protein